METIIIYNEPKNLVHPIHISSVETSVGRGVWGRDFLKQQGPSEIYISPGSHPTTGLFIISSGNMGWSQRHSDFVSLDLVERFLSRFQKVTQVGEGHLHRGRPQDKLKSWTMKLPGWVDKRVRVDAYRHDRDRYRLHLTGRGSISPTIFRNKVLELLEEYVIEANGGEGSQYWNRFETVQDLVLDFAHGLPIQVESEDLFWGRSLIESEGFVEEGMVEDVRIVVFQNRTLALNHLRRLGLQFIESNDEEGEFWGHPEGMEAQVQDGVKGRVLITFRDYEPDDDDDDDNPTRFINHPSDLSHEERQVLRYLALIPGERFDEPVDIQEIIPEEININNVPIIVSVLETNRLVRTQTRELRDGTTVLVVSLGLRGYELIKHDLDGSDIKDHPHFISTRQVGEVLYPTLDENEKRMIENIETVLDQDIRFQFVHSSDLNGKPHWIGVDNITFLLRGLREKGVVEHDPVSNGVRLTSVGEEILRLEMTWDIGPGDEEHLVEEQLDQEEDERHVRELEIEDPDVLLSPSDRRKDRRS